MYNRKELSWTSKFAWFPTIVRGGELPIDKKVIIWLRWFEQITTYNSNGDKIKSKFIR